MLVDSFKDFAASTPPFSTDEHEQWNEARSLLELAPAVRTDLPLLSGSLLLYLCGRFEYFVRDLVVAVADSLTEKASSYSELPTDLRQQLYEQVLTVAKSPEKFGYTRPEAEGLVVALAANLEGRDALESVPSKPLSITESNMNSRVFANIFKRVGIADIWQEIGKQAQLKAHLEKGDDRGCRSEAVNFLDKIMKERNGIAHPTAGTTFPDSEHVAKVCDFYLVLGRVVVDVLLIPR
ncbi:MAE_28990/MAE_18760 family HEPN-like nuclease [Nocardia sp. NPDC051833]|uniref:HEPN domain-containing protein n=1 Tax=Nocardia sp. NPDC051833 TaxID=3155674 RepID=UPI00341C6A4A